jgi:hypothetical protein
MFNTLVWSFDFDLRDILVSDWFFFLASDWLIGRKLGLLIGQISWLLISWRWNTSQSFYHPNIS